MNTSYVAIGTTLVKLFRLFYINKFSLHPRYFLRLLLLIQGGVWSSIFAVVEKIKYQKRIDATLLPDNPIFIVGHWRTGSTFLHQILSLDERFVTPSVFHVTVPDCFISIEKYYKPVMRKMMGNKRPMDNVKFGPDAIQEDEFALFRLTQISPLNKLIFPQSSKYFLLDDDFNPCKKQKERWKKTLIYFYKKLVFQTHKNILIKNPFHSLRIKLLIETFPNAHFIHIYRHPYAVVPSTIRMWDIIATQNCMNSKWQKPSTEETCLLLKTMTETIDNEFKYLDIKKHIDIKFEDLESQPINEIKKIYSHFGWQYSNTFENKINSFLEEEKDFKKNKYELSETEKIKINTVMSEFMADKGYA